MLTKEIWTFFSYVSLAGNCDFEEWTKVLSVRACTALKTRLDYMKDPALWKKYYETLKGDPCKGLGEIKFTAGNVQYRLVGFQRPGCEFVILIGCTHKQDVYKPRDALTTAATRMREVKNGEAKVRQYEANCIEKTRV